MAHEKQDSWLKIETWEKPMRVRSLLLPYYLLKSLDRHEQKKPLTPENIIEEVKFWFPFWDPAWEIVGIGQNSGYAAIYLMVAHESFEILDEMRPVPQYRFDLEILNGEVKNYAWVKETY